MRVAVIISLVVVAWIAVIVSINQWQFRNCRDMGGKVGYCVYLAYWKD